MTQEEFKHYQEQTFDSYCKNLIRNEGRNSLRTICRKSKREVSLSSLTPADEYSIAYLDDYCIEETEMVVHTEQNQIDVADRQLGQALSQLLPQRRAAVVMYYFENMTDEEIGKILNLKRSAVQYRRSEGLKELKRMMEAMGDE